MQQEKIRVCFISPKAYPIFNPQVQTVFGGAEVDLYLLATELAKDPRFDVSFIIGDYGQPDNETRQGVRLLKSLNFEQNALTGAIRIWAALKKADADIYMLKTASPGVPLTQFFCQRHNRRFVYKTASQGECGGDYLRRHPVLGRLFVRSLKKASQVIVQNQQDHDNLLGRFAIASMVIPNGHRIVDVSDVEKKTILWVGRSAAVKGPQRFLELAQAFAQERFVMICPRATGDTDYSALCRRANEIENLRFYEHVSFAEIDRFFAAAKVLVNTSDSEGFANTFIQACKAGTAILSYQVNPDDFLNVYDCGLCGDGTTQTLIDNLQRLLTDDCYRRLGQNGLRYVRKTHDIETIAECCKRLFDNLADTLKRR